MKISVVILNWNRAQDTVKAVRSVLNQDLGNFDILVWDNASSDNSKSELKIAFSDEKYVSLFFADKNYGVAGGRNRAFRETDGNVILSLDNDAVLQDSTALSKIDEMMTGNPTAGALSFEVKRPDGHLMWPFSRPSVTWREKTFETMRVDGCAFAVRRTVFNQIDGFAEHFSPYGVEDQYFAFQVISHGWQILYYPDVVVIHAFNKEGRHGDQFAMHVRNCLWMCMELFPMPRALASALIYSWRLGLDAFHYGTMKFYLKGLATALRDVDAKRRHPIAAPRWKYIRNLMKTDKQLGAQNQVK